MPPKDKKKKGVMTPSSSEEITAKSRRKTQEPKLKGKELKKAPIEEDKLDEAAYKITLVAETVSENVYPYIHTSIKWIIPIESKYSILKPYEAVGFYCPNFADLENSPKSYVYYQAILME